MTSFFDRYRNLILGFALACSVLSMGSTGYLYTHQPRPYKLVADTAIRRIQQDYTMEIMFRDEYKPLYDQSKALQEAIVAYQKRKEDFEKRQAKMSPAKRKQREDALQQEEQRLQEQQQHLHFQLAKIAQSVQKRFNTAMRDTTKALCQKHGWGEIVMVSENTVAFLGDESNGVSDVFVKALKKRLEQDEETPS